MLCRDSLASQDLLCVQVSFEVDLMCNRERGKPDLVTEEQRRNSKSSSFCFLGLTLTFEDVTCLKQLVLTAWNPE